MSTSTARVKTRILIISDTHAAVPKPNETEPPVAASEIPKDGSSRSIHRQLGGFREPLPHADVVLHCGDLTKRSLISEYDRSMAMLRSLDAPLKLFIAGNHDGALDRQFWADMVGSDDTTPDEVERIIKAAEADGVRYLREGTHDIKLENGARLRVYASPFTPRYGLWGFQYTEFDGHHFDIPAGVDVAMTHGPPRGILDTAGYGSFKSSAGCRYLLAAVHKAKPRIHCFGHIHEAWGGKLVRWKDTMDPVMEANQVVDEARSKDVLSLEEVSRDWKCNDEALNEARLDRLLELTRSRGAQVDLTMGDHELKDGNETLVINAAIMSMQYQPDQSPWTIDINLPKA